MLGDAPRTYSDESGDGMAIGCQSAGYHFITGYSPDRGECVLLALLLDKFWLNSN